jgi:hypothetical protein
MMMTMMLTAAVATMTAQANFYLQNLHNQRLLLEQDDSSSNGRVTDSNQKFDRQKWSTLGIDPVLFFLHLKFGTGNDFWERPLGSFGKYRTLCAHDICH